MNIFDSKHAPNDAKDSFDYLNHDKKQQDQQDEAKTELQK